MKIVAKLVAQGSIGLLRPDHEPLHRIVRDGRHSLNFFRLFLAWLVLYSHSFPLSGRGGDPPLAPFLKDISPGAFAVGAFFVLSGYLIGGSAHRSVEAGIPGLRRFVSARFFRIWPALFVVLAASAFIVAPIMNSIAGLPLDEYLTFSSEGPFAYVLRNLFLPIDLQYGILSTFLETPYGVATGVSSVNGSLWTLPFEIRCYALAAVLAVVLTSKQLSKGRPYLLAFFTASISILAIFHPPAFESTINLILPSGRLWLIALFLIGMTIDTVFRMIQLRGIFFVVAVGALIASIYAGGNTFRIIGISSGVFIVMLSLKYTNKLVPAWFRNDLSYGFYLWAFVVQQSLAQVGEAMSMVTYITLSTLLTGAIAMVSWFVIERPALAFVNKAGEPQNPRR